MATSRPHRPAAQRRAGGERGDPSSTSGRRHSCPHAGNDRPAAVDRPPLHLARAATRLPLTRRPCWLETSGCCVRLAAAGCPDVRGFCRCLRPAAAVFILALARSSVRVPIRPIPRDVASGRGHLPHDARIAAPRVDDPALAPRRSRTDSPICFELTWLSAAAAALSSWASPQDAVVAARLFNASSWVCSSPLPCRSWIRCTLAQPLGSPQVWYVFPTNGTPALRR